MGRTGGPPPPAIAPSPARREAGAEDGRGRPACVPSGRRPPPRASLRCLDPDRLREAVTFARRAVCGLLTARPDLLHRLPNNEAHRGGPWPSPRSWEMALCLTAFA